MKEYKLTASDLARAKLAAGWKRGVIILVLVTGMMISLEIVRGKESQNLIAQLIVFLILIPVMLIPIYVLLNYISAKMIVMKNPHYNCINNGEIDENGIIIKNAVCQAKYGWDNVLKVVWTKKLVLIYVGKYVFHLIPIDALSSSEISLLKEKLA